MPQVSQCRNSEYGKVLNKEGFSKCECYTTYWICQNMPWQSSEYIYWVLNMPGFWIWKDSEYARITQGSKYATIWLNMYEYIWIFNNRQGSEYVSCNT